MADQDGFGRLLAEGLRGHTGWKPAWRDPEPKAEYDVIIIGGGGHGLATAYYLAKNHGITNVAVLEQGYLGGGNVGRNTTIVRTNYLHTGNVLFYEKSLQLWEGLSNDLLQRDVLAALDHQRLPQRSSTRRRHPARQSDDPARGRCRPARSRGHPPRSAAGGCR